MKCQFSAAVRGTLLLGMFAVAVSCGKSQSTGNPTAQGNLDDAIKARTEVVALHQEIAATVLRDLLGEREVTKAVQGMRKVIAKAESKQEEGNILLTKDRYTDAASAYAEAAKLYRQALDWRKVQKDLAKAEQSVAAARMLAEASAKPDQLKPATALQINAEGYVEAGEIEKAIAEYGRARQAFEKLAPGARAATLEQAITARTAMQAARDQIKDRPRFPVRLTGDDSKGPKPGSLPDVLSRAQKAEASATTALEERQYASASGLFAAAEKLYREAAVLQGKRDAVAAARKSVEDTMKLANAAFKSSARPASFERGKQALADADKALGDDDIETAKPLLSQAAEQFAAARAEADKMNALADAQQAWAAGLAAADEDLLNRHVASQFAAAKAKAADAQAKSSTALFAEATGALKDAVATAKTKENAAKAVPVLARLDTALASGNKFAVSQVMGELEDLIPGDTRMPSLRQKANALPWPKEASIDLGADVKLEMVMLRNGSFQMGEKQSTHKVTITKPFYLGKFEVTQEQWERVMGSNPSNFKGAKNPVEQVSWEDCQTFIRKLGEKVPGYTFRLPTEAEWEYACRAGSSSEYCYGDDAGGLGEYAWYDGNSGSKTHPVGEKKPNAWGLYDMHGNVWEWCQDWYGNLDSNAATDPVGPSSGSYRVLRGGSWYDDAALCRSASRSSVDPSYRITTTSACG